MYEEKLQGAQKDYGDTCQAQTVGKTCRPASVREQLEKSTVVLGEQSQRTWRALDILRNHPEFEEMLELLELLKHDRLYR